MSFPLTLDEISSELYARINNSGEEEPMPVGARIEVTLEAARKYAEMGSRAFVSDSVLLRLCYDSN